jgi:hypothetical protein
MISRALSCMAITFLVSACITTRTPLLTPAEVMRIAETKAKASGFNPRNYGHTPATFDTTGKFWWIRYYERVTQEPRFAIEIEDKTAKATFKNRESFVEIVH